jgi:hypothetical protein
VRIARARVAIRPRSWSTSARVGKCRVSGDSLARYGENDTELNRVAGIGTLPAVGRFGSHHATAISPDSTLSSTSGTTRSDRVGTPAA